MLNIDTYVEKSSIHGLGLFAGQEVPCGFKIWSRSEDTVFHKSIQEIESMEENSQKVSLLKTISHYGGVTEPGYLTMDLDDMRYINHASEPNLSKGFRANRYIKTGEELTCNYYDFSLPNPYDNWTRKEYFEKAHYYRFLLTNSDVDEKLLSSLKVKEKRPLSLQEISRLKKEDVCDYEYILGFVDHEEMLNFSKNISLKRKYNFIFSEERVEDLSNRFVLLASETFEQVFLGK